MGHYTREEWKELRARRSDDDFKNLLQELEDDGYVSVEKQTVDEAGRPLPRLDAENDRPHKSGDAPAEVRTEDATQDDRPVDDFIATREIGLAQDAGLIGEVADENALGDGVRDSLREERVTEYAQHGESSSPGSQVAQEVSAETGEPEPGEPEATLPAQKLAKEEGVDLSELGDSGSGVDGKITKADVVAVVEAKENGDAPRADDGGSTPDPTEDAQGNPVEKRNEEIDKFDSDENAPPSESSVESR